MLKQFKSLSAGIVFIFSVIVAVGLVAFAVVVTAMLSKYSIEANENVLEFAAGNVAETILGYQHFSDNAELKETIELYQDDLYKSFSKYNTQNIQVYFFDTDGNLLISSEKPGYLTGEKITDSCIRDVMIGGGAFKYAVLDGIDEEQFYTYTMMFEYEGDLSGYVAVRISNSDIGAVRTKMIGVIVAVGIWFFIAMQVAMMVIGTRVSSPVKKITELTKKYAEGDFAERIEFDGNDEIAELAESINSMAARIQASYRERDTFLASVAHDLRTPMTTIAGFADGIRDGTIPPESQEKYLTIISEETRRLSRLVSMLLTTTKMQSEKSLKLSVFNVTDVAIQTLLSFEQLIDEKDLQVELINQDPVYVSADKDEIHQVFYNLIHNAVKFSPRGGALCVDVEKMNAEKASISIKNDGEGIPEEELPYVFQKFYKSDRSRGLDKTGMGLGLFIVKTCISHHGEKITVNSGRNKGCEFVFTLKLAEKPTSNSTEK